MGKKFQIRKQVLATTTVGLHFMTYVLVPTAWALDPGGYQYNPSISQPTPVPGQEGISDGNGGNTYCDDLCGQLISSNGKTPVQPDPQWCTDHGIPINNDLGKSPLPSPLPSNTPTNCASNVPITFQDAGANCDQIANQMTQCQFYNNGQVITQCMAYEAATQVQTSEEVLDVVDLAVAAECYAAAFDPTQALNSICSYAATAAGLGEVIATIAEQNSSVGMAIAGLGGAVGEGVVGAGGAAMGVAGIAAHGLTNDSNTGSGKMTKDGKMSLATAIYFTAVAGARFSSIIAQSNIKSNACNAVQQLVSSVLPSASSSPTGSGSGGSGSGAGGSGGSGASGASAGSNGSQGSGGLQNSVQTCLNQDSGNTAAMQQCISQALGSVQGASDAGIVKNSGLGNAVAPLAGQLANAMQSGASPAAAMGSALGGANLPDGAADALSQLAQAAQDNAGDIAGALGLGSYSGGGGGAGKATASASNPFGSFGSFGGAGRSLASTGKAKQFGAKSRPMDIWHTGTTMNLFEIISGKIGTVTSRVK